VKNILASGIDSLVISMNIDWKDDSFFTVLDELKEKAKEYSLDYQGSIKHFNTEEVFPFTIKPHGTKGFSWILTGADFTYKIAKSTAPNSRPNGMIEFRSEALWRLGVEDVLRIALRIIEANGGHIVEVKLSRADLCVDFLMPEKRWSQGLRDYVVTRAIDFKPHYKGWTFTGMSFGTGAISARLYDKPLEIQQKSKKYWMFDIWGMKEVPQGKKIIRIEFEMKRKFLTEIHIKTPEDLLQKADQVWAYCTKNWLKFQDRPGLHHTQRSTFKWYVKIQDGFRGAQGAEPLVREKAVKMDKKKLMQQANGLIQSLHAINQEEKRVDQNKPVSMEDCINSYINEVNKHHPYPSEVQDKVTRKRAKFHREEPMIEEGQMIYRLRRYEK
jgi:hypothetical protein